jgi:hypothetical protein
VRLVDEISYNPNRDSKPLLQDRHTNTRGHDLTAKDNTLYNEVTTSVRSKCNEANTMKNRSIELTLMVMQQRLASRLCAFTRALANRLRAFNEVLSIVRAPDWSEPEKNSLPRGTPDPSRLRDLTEYKDSTDEKRERLQPLFIQRSFKRAWTPCNATDRITGNRRDTKAYASDLR